MERFQLFHPRSAACRAPVRLAHLALALLLAALLPASAGAALYVPDPNYNTGLMSPDAFAGSFSRNYEGRKIVRLANDDIVVAGLVPKFESGTALSNLGLVRYNTGGGRIAWSNPTAAYAFFGNQYLVFPNRNEGDPGSGNDLLIDDVKDMTVYGDRIFVLVDGYFQNFGGPLVSRSRVVVFKTDGQFLASAAIGPSDTLGGGIAVYDNGLFPATVSLVYGGYTNPQLGTSRAVYARYIVAANGAMDEVVQNYPNPLNVCPTNRACEIHGVALGGTVSAPRVYLAGARQRNASGDWDFLALALDTSGTPIATFGDGGAKSVAFDRGGNLFDRANDIVVDRGLGIVANDQIYLVGDVAQDCKPGAGIAKLTQDGALDDTFGEPNFIGPITGKRVVGGSGSNPCPLNLPTTSAIAATLADNRLAIAGHQSAPCIFVGGGGCEDDVNGMAIVLGADTGDIGEVVSFDRYPYTDTLGGPRTRHSDFSGIVASGGGTFTVAGFARYFQSGPGAPHGTMQYATLRIKPTFTVFADGFESD